MKKRWAALAAAVALAVLSGCGQQAKPGGGGESGSAAGGQAETGSGGAQGGGEKTIKIGLIAPLTGDVKTFGESTKNGFQLALEHAGNKAGDYKIEPVIQDDRNDATEGVNVATRLITQEKVKAIVGSVTSGVTIPISQYANDQKVVMVTGTATNPKVTVGDDGKRKPYIFRACFIDPFQGTVAAKFALGDPLKVKTAAILYDKGNDYTVGLAQFFKEAFEAGGGKVVAEETYTKNDQDFSAILTKIAEKKPELLYLPDYYNMVSLIAKQAKAKGLDVPMLGGDGWDSKDLDYETLAGNYFTNHYSSDDQRPEVQKFVKEYEAKYGSKPDALAALAYDATNMLLAGISQANSDDTDKIREAIQNLKDFPAVSGKISIDQDGNPVKPAVILKVKADKTQEYVTTVSP